MSIAEREDRVEQDLAGDVDVVAARHPVRQRATSTIERDEQNHAPCRPVIMARRPNRPCGRSSSTMHHRQEQHEVGKFGKQRLPVVIEKADDEAADERAEQAAGAAENDDDQRQRQHVEVEAGIDRQDRRADEAGKSGERRAEAIHDGEQPRDADADHARHLRDRRRWRGSWRRAACGRAAARAPTANTQAIRMIDQRDRSERSVPAVRTAPTSSGGVGTVIGSPVHTIRQKSATMKAMPSVTSTCASLLPASRRNRKRSTGRQTRRPRVAPISAASQKLILMTSEPSRRRTSRRHRRRA